MVWEQQLYMFLNLSKYTFNHHNLDKSDYYKLVSAQLTKLVIRAKKVTVLFVHG